MARELTIVFRPDDTKENANVQTGEVTNLEVLDFLKTLSKHFAREVIKDYQEITGDTKVDPDKLEDYMQFLREANL